MEPPSEPPPRSFSINSGGPYARLIERLHLVRPTGVIRGWWMALVAWAPLPLGTALRLTVGLRPDPMMFDLSVHARLLVGLPLLLVASHLLEPQCNGAVRQLYAGGFADPAAADRIIDRAEWLRDAAWIEGALLAVALTMGQLALWGVTGPSGLVHGNPQVIWSVSRVWYSLVALPLVQFLALRWVWRWVIWNYIVVRVSRLELAATAAHPDRAAGLGFLSWPVGGYTWYVAAVASTFAGAWATQLLNRQSTVPALLPSLLLFLADALAVGCGPLLFLSMQVYRARRRDLAAYGLFALDYVRQFRARWIDGQAGEPVLGTPDIQSLSDLDNAFQAIVATRVHVFAFARLRNIVLAVMLPMVPLIATVIPIEEVTKRLFSTVLGGLPL